MAEAGAQYQPHPGRGKSFKRAHGGQIESRCIYWRFLLSKQSGMVHAILCLIRCIFNHKMIWKWWLSPNNFHHNDSDDDDDNDDHLT